MGTRLLKIAGGVLLGIMFGGAGGFFGSRTLPYNPPMPYNIPDRSNSNNIVGKYFTENLGQSLGSIGYEVGYNLRSAYCAAGGAATLGLGAGAVGIAVTRKREEEKKTSNQPTS